MAIFDLKILEIEGDYSNDPDDAGGETKYGISKRSYPNEDIKNLTPERAVEIYIRDFWGPNRLKDIINQDTANIIFRFSVNAGNETAVRETQECLNTLVSDTSRITIDGILGIKTLQCINGITPLHLQNALRVSICRYYLDLVKLKPSQKKYFQGWINRALL